MGSGSLGIEIKTTDRYLRQMATDYDLVCNFRKCRKGLKNNAWVTSCSHIFCDEHGAKEFQNSLSCPACETSLTGKYDVIRIDIQPTEQYKSMVLAGQRPETIMDICTRALSFWTYQAHQERAYQEYVANKAKERAIQQEQYYEQLIGTIRTELKNIKIQLSAMKKDNESLRQQYNESQEKIMEKHRQYQKLQLMYDSMRRKFIRFDQGDIPMQITPRLNRPLLDRELFMSREDILLRGNVAGASDDHKQKTFSSPKDFIFRPNVTPIIGTVVNDDTGTGKQNRK